MLQVQRSVAMSSTASIATHILDLPSTWWGSLFQHVASASDGIATTAALCQTCTAVYTHNKELTYSSVVLKMSIRNPCSSFWSWLTKREGRIAQLTITIAPFSYRAPPPGSYRHHLYHRENYNFVEDRAAWEAPLRLLSTIPDLRLTLSMPPTAPNTDPPLSQWLKEQSSLISELVVTNLSVDGSGWLSLADLVEAAAPCKKLTFKTQLEPFDRAREEQRRCAQAPFRRCRPLTGFTQLAALTQLTSLSINYYHLSNQQPWVTIASLSNLKQLECCVNALEDPSPISALTRLSSLSLSSLFQSYTLKRLQPFSTLKQLEVLRLSDTVCSATSLHGLEPLCSLRDLELYCDRELVSLHGLAAGVTRLALKGPRAKAVRSLDGIEAAAGSLQELELSAAGVTSLLPLATFSSLRVLKIEGDRCSGCGLTSLAGLEGLGSSLQVLTAYNCTTLQSLAGIEQLQALQELRVEGCSAVSSLQSLCELRELQHVDICGCTEVVAEDALVLPYTQPAAYVKVFRCGSLREVVLAGGVRRGGGDSVVRVRGQRVRRQPGSACHVSLRPVGCG